MLWAVLSTFFDALASISRKKSLELNSILSAYGFKILGMFGPLVLVPFFLIFALYSFQNFTLFLGGIIFLVCCIRILSTNMSQYIYKNEKITTLMPYENLNKVMSIIASFYILQDGNIKTVIVAFVVILLLLFSSVDIKNIRLPRIFSLVFIHESLIALRALLTAFVLKKLLNYVDYYLIESCTLAIFLIIGALRYRDFHRFPLLDKKFYAYRLTAGFFGSLSNVISLYLITSIGLIGSIILSFLGIVTKLCMSGLILKETIQKKDIFLALSVTGLVAIGFFVK